MLFADGMDAAFLGVARRCGQPDLAVYSVQRAIRVLRDRDGMSEDEAREHLEFNLIGAWLGEETPIWLERCTVSDLTEIYSVDGSVH
tara:strand:+ start:313 stop:573 length:261 start_codon:yes stop_codon:yes gene_type:complete